MTVKISYIEYQIHRSEYNGLCTSCGEWTCGGVEPDAEGYDCDVCGEPTVIGAETAFLTDAFEMV